MENGPLQVNKRRRESAPLFDGILTLTVERISLAARCQHPTLRGMLTLYMACTPCTA
jgi:hypothetical protein